MYPLINGLANSLILSSMKAKLKDFFSVYYKLTFQEAATLTKIPLKNVIELINELLEDREIFGKINEIEETIVIEDQKNPNEIIDDIKDCSRKIYFLRNKFEELIDNILLK